MQPVRKKYNNKNLFKNNRALRALALITNTQMMSVCVSVCVCEWDVCVRVCVCSEGRLQMSVFTDADGPGLVPAGLAVPPHDAGEGGVPLQGVASVTLVGDRGAQLEVGSHARPVPHRARLEARLPWVLCGAGEEGERRERGGRGNRREGETQSKRPQWL